MEVQAIYTLQSMLPLGESSVSFLLVEGCSGRVRPWLDLCIVNSICFQASAQHLRSQQQLDGVEVRGQIQMSNTSLETS